MRNGASITSMGVGLAAFRWTVGSRQRQGVLNIGNVFLIQLQLRAFGLVADEQRCLIRSLHTRPPSIDVFIRREDHIDFGAFQIQPFQIAGIIIVR